MSHSTPPGAGLMARRLQVGPLAVDVRGTFTPERPPVVLVHGIGMSGEYFLPFADELSAGYDVYVLDLPGYGTTPKPARPLTVPELAEVVADTIRALGVVAPVVVGHSMGCQVVVDTVAGHPGLCCAYVLIGPTVDPAARSLPAQGWRLLRDTLGEPAATNAVVFRNYARMGPVRYLRTARHMLADRIEAGILRCAIPGLIIRGERDPIAPHRWARHLAELAPNARWAEVPDAPHALQHNQPQELSAACAHFLASVLSRRCGSRTGTADA